jgi:WD40 repeat protein
MKGHRLQLTVALALAAIGHGQPRDLRLPADYPYCPAFVSTSESLHRELVVFPPHGKSFKISIPSLGAATFSPDGRSLYGPCTPYRDQEKVGERIKFATCRVDLYTGSSSPVPGTAHDLAGRSGSPPSGVVARLALAPPDGRLTRILVPEDGQPWLHLTLSPDGERAIALHNRRLELVDVIHGTAKPLGDKWFIAEWSPDGKWLAAVENGEDGRTVLMNAATLASERAFGHSELAWSPDSRYLLGLKDPDGCGFQEAGTLEAIDIRDGSRATIESSRCRVDRANVGWVKCDVPAR